MKTTIKNQIGRIILLSGFVLLSSQVFAHETFSVKGRVQNTSKESIKSAVVTLSDIKTLETVATATCNAKGDFIIDKVIEGDYILTVQKDGISRAKSKIISLDESGVIVEKKVERKETLQLIDVIS